jgi:hypothetical protein
MNDELFADGVDGIHGLRRRARTRLWYRTLPPVELIPEHLRAAIQNAPHLNVTAPDLVQVARVQALQGSFDDFEDTFLGEWPADLPNVSINDDVVLSSHERQTRLLRRLGAEFDPAAMTAEPPAAEAAEAPLTDWRIVARNAPTLLLASTNMLDGRQPGPILGPGREYRVLSAVDGIVGLEVRDEDGATATGYCNAVDLICIEPMVVDLATAGWKKSTKQKLSRVTKGLSNVTGSLISFAS